MKIKQLNNVAIICMFPPIMTLILAWNKHIHNMQFKKKLHIFINNNGATRPHADCCFIELATWT
jgi:hypothetical protein